ncbi:hypothetical protein ACBJ59_17395 [Nonomuraea sp. MTCD27]
MMHVLLERRPADGTFLLSGQTVPDDLGGVILAGRVHDTLRGLIGNGGQ